MGVSLTIGMPVFNDVHFIEQSIESLLRQTYIDFKLIISDDGSTDGSQAICERYASIDNRITYIRQPINLGISRNMQFLLSKADTKYFMWAGDDDLYDEVFIEKLIKGLELSNSIVAFCCFEFIDENNNTIKLLNFDYSNPKRIKRMHYFIKNANDGFGYGIFITDKIRGVEFPVWWEPNKNTPYNNIYPTLCYYLAKGDYVHVSNKALFFKRQKSTENTNHELTGENSAIKESFAYWIRRFNLVVFSSKMILKAGSFWLVLLLFPALFYYWFLIPSFQQFKLALCSFIKNRLV